MVIQVDPGDLSPEKGGRASSASREPKNHRHREFIPGYRGEIEKEGRYPFFASSARV